MVVAGESQYRQRRIHGKTFVALEIEIDDIFATGASRHRELPELMRENERALLRRWGPHGNDDQGCGSGAGARTGTMIRVAASHTAPATPGRNRGVTASAAITIARASQP